MEKSLDLKISDRFKVTAKRWPWQENGRWNGNGLGRFGGGWNYALGFELGGFKKRSSIIFNLLYGTIRISWDFRPRHEIASERMR